MLLFSAVWCTSTDALVWNFIFSNMMKKGKRFFLYLYYFIHRSPRCCHKAMAHTHSGCYETNSRASSVSNWERLQGRASTPGGTGRLGAAATFHHLTQQLVIKPIRYGWKTHPPPFYFSFSSLITLRASWFTSPSQLNVDDSLFFFSIVDADESQFNGYAMVYSEIKSIFRIVFP